MSEVINNDELTKDIYLSESNKTNVFEFINNTNKLSLLIKANEILKINDITNNKLIFVYSQPKVGSTSIVSSLRIFGSNKFNIIHIHDEEMLKILVNIEGISINEIILYNSYLGKDVYVIDIYRSPIERKISTFFEKIGSYHFNNTEENINSYNVTKIINRFNKIFPYIGLGDHFIDRYNIQIPIKFDTDNKYLLVRENGVSYIKLRLNDSNIWGQILTSIFGTKILIVKDYESSRKPIKNLYDSFKNNYRIPINLLNEILNCKYFNYYYSKEEQSQYYNEWLLKSTDSIIQYTPEQYKIYKEITIENSYFDYIQQNHYIDEGCLCNTCNIKRDNLAYKIINGIQINDRIIHMEAKNELIQTRVSQVNRINRVLKNIQNIKKPKPNNFNKQIAKIVSGNRF